MEVPSGNYEIQIPVGWSLYNSDDLSQISFISDDDSTMLQILYYPGDLFNSTQAMYQQLLENLQGQGDESEFTYLDWNAWLADHQFELNEMQYRGWFLLLDGSSMDYQLNIFTLAQDYEENFPWIISTLDAFSPGEEGTRNSGIIETMMQAGQSSYLQINQSINDFTLQYTYDLNLLQTTQDLIEREAQLLNQYSVNPPMFRLAWERYYNLVYRDNYAALIPFFQELQPMYDSLGSEAFIDSLLQWLQNFQYASSNTFSDLLSPLNSLIQQKGDCDSLALLYLMTLEYFDISGVLMVSEEYSHAMAAVESDKEGASFELDGKRYVVAEMTDQVALGQIASSMADLDKWQMISFPR